MAAISPSTPPQTRSPHEYVSLWICRKNQSKEKKSWQQQRRLPGPLSRRSPARARCKRCASLKMVGILAILQKYLWHTRSIHAGETDRSLSTDETKLLLSSLASGPSRWEFICSGLSPPSLSRSCCQRPS